MTTNDTAPKPKTALETAVDNALIDPFRDAIRDQLRALIDSDDFSVRTLEQIAQVAPRLQEVMLTLDPASGAVKNKPRVAPGIYSNTGSVLGSGVTIGSNFLAGEAATGGDLSAGLGGETYGAKMLREMLAGFQQTFNRQDPVKLVQAIAEARDKGLDDIARNLEERLDSLTGSKPKTSDDTERKSEPPPLPECTPVLEGAAEAS